MKQILASLLAAYVLTNGQAPPAEFIPANTAAAVTTAATTAAQAQAAITTAAGTTTTVAQAPPPAPVTPSPVTPSPVTPSPVTPSPTTPAPVTPRPTYNPHCPLDAGQQSGFTQQSVQYNENAVCFTPNEVAGDYLGKLRCDNFACCQCAQINCGFNGYPCEQLQIGDSGAVGVQSINVRGAPEMGNNGLQNIFGGGVGQNGATLECLGRESCMGAVIRGELISDTSCLGDMGCQDAKIVLNEPIGLMNMQCNGLMSCQRADIEINVGIAEAAAMVPGQVCNPAFAGVVQELGKVEFNGQQSGANAIVTIRNQGCGLLLIEGFECMSMQACPGLAVNIEGNVAIKNCDLMGVSPGSPAIQSLVAACQAGQNYINWAPGNTVPVPPQQPPFPVPPVYQPPVNPPVNNPPPVIPPNPSFPVPAPPQFPVPSPPQFPPFPVPGTGFGQGIVDPRSAGLQCDQVSMPMAGGFTPNPRACAGTTQTIQIANNFVLDCSLAGACNGMTLILNAGYDPTRNPLEPTTRIDSLKFIQPTSDVTIYINNDFGAMGQPVRINDVRCEGPNRCRNLKIIAGPGVDILSTNFDCNEISACIGATVSQGTMTMPLDPRTAGFGQAPQFPVQPQPQPNPPQVPANPGQFTNPWAQI